MLRRLAQPLCTVNMTDIMIYKKTLFILFLLIIFVASCSDNSVNSDNEKIPGLFVVDSFSTKIDKQQFQQNDTFTLKLSYKLYYHFENQPGTIQSLFIIFQDSIGRGTNIDYAFPKPINESGHFDESFDLSVFSINNADSIKFDIYISGAFWDYNFETLKFNGFLGEFNWSESKWILVPK